MPLCTIRPDRGGLQPGRRRRASGLWGGAGRLKIRAREEWTSARITAPLRRAVKEHERAENHGQIAAPLRRAVNDGLLLGASRGPRPIADGLVSVTGLAMAGHSRNPRLAWLQFKSQKTIQAIKYLNIYCTKK